MKPGRELDKLMALAFGWKEWEFSNPGRDGQEAFRYKTLVPSEYDGSNLQHLNMIMPHYSTDIGAAMQAFEWLENNHPWGQNIFLCLCRGGVRKEHQSVRINQIGEWEEIIAHREIIGESYAHAICLAVLLARVETRF